MPDEKFLRADPRLLYLPLDDGFTISLRVEILILSETAAESNFAFSVTDVISVSLFWKEI